MTSGRGPVQTGFFFLSGHRCWKNQERRRREEEKKGWGETVPESKLAKDSLEPVCGLARGRDSIFGSCCFN